MVQGKPGEIVGSQPSDVSHQSSVAALDEDGDRVSELRRRCLDRKNQRYFDPVVVSARSLRASENVDSWQLRRGLLCRDRLASLEFAIDDLEFLAGRLELSGAENEEEIRGAREYLGTLPRIDGQTGHCELDLSRLFELGIEGLCEEIGQRREASTGKERNVYQSFLDALSGFSEMVENAARTVESASLESPSFDRQRELEGIARSCHRIAHAPPESFRDAIQLLWFADLGVMAGDSVGLVVPGHLDRTLYPFFEADCASGILTSEEDLLLIESLYLLINEFIPDGLAMSVMVGGRDADGNDVTNELSHLCLEALRRTSLIYPTVGVCWHDETPRELADLAVGLISEGYSTVAFFGDETIQRGLRGLGVPSEGSCNYINSTCVEITPVGSSNVWVASPYFPLCEFLLEEIAEQADSSSPAPDFEAFLARYGKRLSGYVAKAVAEQNEFRSRRQAYGGKPLQSVFTRDCVDGGRDIDDGGARYNWVECSFVGLANLADSLQVIEKEVYEEKRLALQEMKTILDDDFEGAEPVRQRWLNGYPKYGNDDGEVDRLVKRMVDLCVQECGKHRMIPDASPFVPGAFCWIMHEQLGRRTGATPDGRRAGFPFADGCGPAQGREQKGPTAAILSTTSWSHSPLIGGAAYNMKFNTSLFGEADSVARLWDLILTFLRRGGFETQVNVVDIETLRKARELPDEYRDLIVRIGGYCDYFTRLSPEMQEEVMMRTEFSND